VILRHATAADRDAVVALSLHFHQSTPYGQLLTVDADRIAALFNLALAQGVVLVAEVERPTPPAYNHTRGDSALTPCLLCAHTLVAFLGVVATEHSLSGDRYAEEVAWWVEPAYRTGTLGPRLLVKAEEWARAAGCAFLTMRAPAGTDVGRFYERLGYQLVETAFLKRVA